MMAFGGVAVAAGLTLFAFSGIGGSRSAYAGTGTSTPVAGGTVTGTATAGPLTPVASPTTSGGAGGATTTPSAGGAELPSTGTGSSSSGDFGLIAALGLGLAALGGGFVFAGTRRNT